MKIHPHPARDFPSIRVTFLVPGSLIGSRIAVFAAFLRNAGHEPSVVIFSACRRVHLAKMALYIGKVPAYLAVNIKGNETLFVIYAISYMSLSEIESIVTYLKLHFEDEKLAVLENSQAVTAFDLDAESERLFDAGADFNSG